MADTALDGAPARPAYKKFLKIWYLLCLK